LIETIDTPYGIIATPICYKMEYHRFIRQVGQNHVDILIVPGEKPSKDNAVVHTELSMFRAVENGCSMLRTTLEGLTMGMDNQGRVISQMNYYLTLKNRTIITELPTNGVRTLYSSLGDWFAYSCCILLILLILLGVRKRMSSKKMCKDGERLNNIHPPKPHQLRTFHGNTSTEANLMTE